MKIDDYLHDTCNVESNQFSAINASVLRKGKAELYGRPRE